MTHTDTRLAARNTMQERRNELPDGKTLREQLLAGLPVTERSMRLGGVSTLVLEGGDGPPIIFLHGPGEYGAKWRRIIPDLATTHRIIAPDLPGHGMTEMFDDGPATDRMLAWLDELIERTCGIPPILVGHVLGGAVAARFASDRSERLSRLVLVDALGLAAFQPTPEFSQALTDFSSGPTEETHDRLWRRCAFRFDAMRAGLGESWDWIKAYNLDRAHAPGLRDAQLSLMHEFGISEIPPAKLAAIAVPTTLIWGKHDLATPLSVAQAASNRHGWALHVIENAGDDPAMEQPEAFLGALRAALGSRASNRATVADAEDRRAAWDRIAAGYDRTNTPTQMWIAGEGLRRADLRPGMRFLDVAAGSGALAIPAARKGANVLATDRSSAMLELLGMRARQEGLRVEIREMDGHALELEDDSFDMAGSQFGVMLFPDMPKGIREMVRVVKPGGRVLVLAYGDPHKIDFLDFFARAVQSVRPDFSGPMDPPPLEFQLADPATLRRELVASGLHDVTVETITEVTEHKTGQGLWEWLVYSNPIVESVLGTLGLTSEERDVVIVENLERLVRERAGGGLAARLANPVNIGIGTK
jgi:pimeloyl-ACP methyl ester carboxylesterase/ubiquinone/menaquinone biosynthesis C-methylase UbiE